MLGRNPGTLEFPWCLIAQGAMRALLIVVVAEGRKPHAGLNCRGEDVHVQAFIAHRAIEPLLLSILPGAAWVNVQCGDLSLREPPLHRDSHKLRPIIAAQLGWRTIVCHKFFQPADHAFRRTACVDIDC